MKIEIYTKPNCPLCIEIKQLLNICEYEYLEKELTSDNIGEFMKYTRSAPVVFVDDEFVANDDIINSLSKSRSSLLAKEIDLDSEF